MVKKRTFTAGEIATLLKGTIEGNPAVKVSGISKIEEGEPGTISFLANPKYEPFIYQTKSSIIIVNKDFAPEQQVTPTLVKVPDAYSAFAQLLDIYSHLKSDLCGISPQAQISPSAQIGRNVYIGEFVVVGENVVIGDNVKIHANTVIAEDVIIGDDTLIYYGVKIYPDSIIGKNCTIHAGVVIGADGFGFAPQNGDLFKKVKQLGNVVIEDHVEIGANTTIDRATIGSTLIKRGVKLDNLIQIGHNVVVGENTVIASQTGISGSSKIGKNCMIGGQVGIAGHLIIPDNVKIAAQSGIASSLKNEGEVVMGSPASEIHHFKKNFVHFRNLSKYVQRIDELEKMIQELKNQIQ